MSKERLEEIKQYYSRMESLDEYTQSDIKWLIEQAERAQELEKFKRDVEQMYRYIHLNSKKSVREKEALQGQNKRYREALELIKLKTLDIKGNKDTRPFQIYGIASEALEVENE